MSLDVSIIEPTESPPITVSDDSINIKECNPFKCPLPKTSSSNWSEPGTSKAFLGEAVQSCCCRLQQVKPCLKKKACFGSSHVAIQNPERCDVCQVTSKKFAVDVKEECDGSCQCQESDELIAVKSKTSVETETVKTEMADRSCSTIQDSGGARSLVDSATGTCDAKTRADYFHNKLRSAMQILQNKEETIRVQAESLSVAEERISKLTERASELRVELDRKTKELHNLRNKLESVKVEKIDVSISADSEIENQSDLVTTLQNNLSVIEELYRECFYETARQEDLIDMLRKSYLDVRLMDKQKADQIGRMQTVINTQKWSLDRCQDIALEVDNLKSEICNFLSSSTSTNNDSGMWERSEESFASIPGVQEDLQEVMEQLLKLREILTLGCTCGLIEENEKLRQQNVALEEKIREMCENQCEIQRTLSMKENLEKQYKKQIEIKDEQLTNASLELEALVEKSREHNAKHETLSAQLRQMEELLGKKAEELSQMQKTCDAQRDTIMQISHKLQKTEKLCEENCQFRAEVSNLTSHVDRWRTQLAESECRVRKLDAKLRQTQECYDEQERSVRELRAALGAARARGAALCADVRRATAALRHWAARMRDRHREHEKRIKEKNNRIAILQRQIKRCQSGGCMMCDNVELATGSKCSTSTEPSSCCSNLEPRHRLRHSCSCQSEIASCSTAPTPPRRERNKQTSMSSWLDASVQTPSKENVKHVCLDPRVPYCSQPETTSRGISTPTDELYSRIKCLSKSFNDGYRRWSKAEPR